MSLVKYERKAVQALRTAQNLAKSPAGQMVKKVLSHPTTQRIAKQGGKMILKAGQSLAGSAWDKLSSLFNTRSPQRDTVSTAPVSSSSNLHGFKWAFGQAPDVGIGPGCRLQARFRAPTLETRVEGTNSGGWQVGGATGSGLPLLVLDPSVDTSIGDQGTFPTFVNGITGVQSLAKCFTRFLVRHVGIEYAPIVGTSTGGSVAFAYNTDSARMDQQISLTTNGVNYNLAMGCITAAAQAVWQPNCTTLLHIPPNAPISPADLFYVHTESSIPAGSSEGRLEVQGAIVFGEVGVPNSTSIATPILEVVIDFYEPAIVTTSVQLQEQKVVEAKEEEELKKVETKEEAHLRDALRKSSVIGTKARERLRMLVIKRELSRSTDFELAEIESFDSKSNSSTKLGGRDQEILPVTKLLKR